jgi:signal peptidase I
MAPTLLVGDHLLANKYTYQFRAPSMGDLVVFTYPVDQSKDFLQRVMAVGGDTIEIRNKKVVINGKLYNDDPGIHMEDTVLPTSESPRDNLLPLKVPENAFFVLGDNRDHSLDSRFWGVVGRHHIVGRPFLIYWSYDSASNRVRTERIGKWIQ